MLMSVGELALSIRGCTTYLNHVNNEGIVNHYVIDQLKRADNLNTQYNIYKKNSHLLKDNLIAFQWLAIMDIEILGLFAEIEIARSMIKNSLLSSN